jgi:hypothetical protein
LPGQSIMIDEFPDRIKPLKANLSKACFDFITELPTVMRHWPKLTRMGLGKRLEEKAYHLLESAVIVSNPSSDSSTKRRTLKDMSNCSDILLVYLRLAYIRKELAPERYKRLFEQVIAIGKQVGGLGKFLDGVASK